MGKYDAIAIFGKYPLFRTLSLFADGRFYEDACVDAARKIEIFERKTGIDRRILPRGLSRAECVRELDGCKIYRGKGRLPRITGGEFLVLTGGRFFAIYIDASAVESPV